MFANAMVAAIDAARTLTNLDHLSRDIWAAWGAGQIGDEAQLLAMQLEARRKALRGEIKPVGIPPGRPSIFPPRRPQRAPMRAVAIARRRYLAASGPMPPALASRFTTGELAVLRIVSDEFRAGGQCAQCIDAIAARAGVCRRLAQNAIRQAARLGLLTIQERRREGQKNLPNIVRVISREWIAWMRTRAHRMTATPASGGTPRDMQTGCKKDHPTVNKLERSGAPSAQRAADKGGSGQGLRDRQGFKLAINRPRSAGI